MKGKIIRELETIDVFTLLAFPTLEVSQIEAKIRERKHQYIKDSKVEICRGGRSTIAVEAIAVETIAVEAIAVEMITVEAIAVHLEGGSIDNHC